MAKKTYERPTLTDEIAEEINELALLNHEKLVKRFKELIPGSKRKSGLRSVIIDQYLKKKFGINTIKDYLNYATKSIDGIKENLPLY